MGSTARATSTIGKMRVLAGPRVAEGPLRVLRLARFAICALAFFASTAQAETPDNLADIPILTVDQIIGKAVRKHFTSLVECYQKVLAIDRDKQGTVFVKITLGAHDTVESAKIMRDEMENTHAKRCLVSLLEKWTLPGSSKAGAGRHSEIIVPLTFKASPSQFLISIDDVPLSNIPKSTSAKKLLLSNANVGAVSGELTLLHIRGNLSLSPATTDRVFYILKGKGWTKSKKKRRMKLRKGDSFWLSPKAPSFTVTSSGGEMKVLEFRLKTPPAKVTHSRKKFLFDQSSKRESKLKTRFLKKSLKEERFAIGRTTIEKGKEIFRDPGPSFQDLMIFVLEGKGTTRIGDEARDVTAQDSTYSAKTKKWTLFAKEKMKIIWFTIPACIDSRVGSGSDSSPDSCIGGCGF